MIRPNYFVLTGAMGSGKSAVIRELRRAGMRCVSEPAREILAEQRSIGSDGVPEQNPALFCQLMLSRSLHDYHLGMDVPDRLVFDRGIPDMVAYAGLFSLDPGPFYRAAEQYRYNPMVFFFAGWEEIYTQDAERKMSFELASRFGERVQSIYRDLGYQIIAVPLGRVEDRASFLLNRLRAWSDP